VAVPTVPVSGSAKFLLDDVLKTEELRARPSRLPDYEAENRALAVLTDAMANTPDLFIEIFVKTACGLCRAGSAGVCLLESEPGPGFLRWHAIAGPLALYQGGGMPRDASPCGMTLDRNTGQLFAFPERYFDYGVPVEPPIVEALIVPFEVSGKRIGTVWVVIHTPAQAFDLEDLRLLTSLARVAAAAYQMSRALQRMTRDIDAVERLRHLGMLFAVEGRVEPLLDQIVATAISIGDADFGTIQLLDPQSGELRIAAQHGFPPWWLDFWDSVQSGQGSCGTALARGERVLVYDVEQSPIFVGTQALEVQRRVGVRGIQSTPLMSRSGKLLGMFSTHYKTPYRPDERTLGLFDLLARQAADMIDRSQLESALHESDQQLRKLIQSSSDAIYRLSPDGKQMRYLISRNLATAPCEPNDNWLTQHIHPDDRSHVSACLAEAIRTKTVLDLEHRTIRMDGTMSWLHSRAIPILDAKGQITEWFGMASDVTARKEAEEEMRKSEIRYRTLVDAVSAITWSCPPDGFQKQTQPAWMSFTGQTADEMLGSGWARAIHPDDLAHVCRTWNEAIQRGVAYRSEHRVRRHDGQNRWMSVHAVPIRDLEGQIVEWTGMHIDITDRKHAEELAREKQAILKAALDSMLDAVLILDTAGQFIDFNQAFVTFHRFSSRDELLLNLQNKPEILEVFFPDGTRTPLKMYAAPRALRGETAMEAEYSLRRKDTGASWTGSYNFAPIRDSRGLIVGAVVVARDITERKRLENEKREREERLRAILDTAVDAIITLDRQGVIISVNRATECMFGHQQAELMGQKITILMPSLFHDEYWTNLLRYLEMGENRIVARRREATARRRDGSNFPVELAISEMDSHLGTTCFIRDITERKELQRHVLEVAAEEQRRIAYELHDGIQQELTGLSLFVGLVDQTLQGLDQASALCESEADEIAPSPTASKFALMKELTERITRGLADTHRHVEELAHGMLPVPIDADGLRAAMESLAASVQPKVACQFDTSGDVTISNNTIASHVYRIAQEALNNAISHGQADVVRISLVADQSLIILEVIDNGIGIEQTQALGGMGMQTMEYRANLIGGVLQVERLPHGGTSLRCVFPQNLTPISYPMTLNDSSTSLTIQGTKRTRSMEHPT